MKPSYRFYRGFYRLARFFLGIFYRLRVSGTENIPEGAALVCANHSSNVDPFLIAFAFGVDRHMHVIAKVELFRIPVVAQVMKKLGMIKVNRDGPDTATIMSTFSYLKKNEKVVVFPEGTRVVDDNAASVKSGAVKIAERTGVAVVPVYLPRKKPLFSKVLVIIGEPYYIKKAETKRSPEEYAVLADEMMAKISGLDPGSKAG